MTTTAVVSTLFVFISSFSSPQAERARLIA
jgi:hypothetical protein